MGMSLRLIFIRHAIAKDRDKFEGDDLKRPLTAKGRRKAKAIFARLTALRPAPERVISSTATRARETADLFCEAFQLAGPQLDASLNPGARPGVIIQLLQKLPSGIKSVALVGHEPDFTQAISALVADGHLNARLKKCGMVELEWSAEHGGTLVMALPPDILSR